MAVNPVLPPSAIPAPLSMKAVTGELPNKAPTEMKAASVQSQVHSTHLGARHYSFLAYPLFVPHLIRTAPKSKGSGISTSDRADSSRVREADFSEEEADTNTRGSLDSGGDQLDEPLAHTCESKKDEDETFDKDSCEGERVRDGTTSIVSDDLKGEVGVEAHTRTVKE
ncbi:hypothetical protein HG531_009642 [Fusarium graminearum]|nr:hypothetical protein HG531_009642 [Fusarium graminearum]